MKFINYLIIKGRNIPSAAYGIFSIDHDQLLATPISDRNCKTTLPDVYFYRSYNSDFHSVSLTENPTITSIRKLLTRKINNYYHVWFKH